MAPTQASRSLGSVLVVGGCGFLGHHIVTALIASKLSSSIAVLDLHPPRQRLAHITYHTADITDAASLGPIFASTRPDVVIHTASPLMSTKTRSVLQAVNVRGTQNLLRAAADAGSVKALVYTSSASVVSDNKTDLISADERWPYVPERLQTEYYSHTKAVAEQMVLAANRAAEYNPDMLTVALRPAGIFGEGDVQSIPKMLEVYANGQTGFQLGDNDNLFDFTYVGNVADAHLLAASALLATHRAATAPLDHEKVDGEPFFITNDSPVYFWDFPRAVWKHAGDTTGLNVWKLSKPVAMLTAVLLSWVLWLVGRKARLSPTEVRFSCMTRYYSCDKAKARLGYRPLVGVGEGIQRAVRAWQQADREGGQKKTQ